MRELRLSLKKKWFEITVPNGKTEDYREINEYWIKRFVSYCSNMSHLIHQPHLLQLGRFDVSFKKFDCNTMTLDYPKSNDNSRIKKYEHLGIEIGYGKEEWGAEPGKLYFIIKHGKQL